MNFQIFLKVINDSNNFINAHISQEDKLQTQNFSSLRLILNHLPEA